MVYISVYRLVQFIFDMSKYTLDMMTRNINIWPITGLTSTSGRSSLIGQLRRIVASMWSVIG